MSAFELKRRRKRERERKNMEGHLSQEEHDNKDVGRKPLHQPHRIYRQISVRQEGQKMRLGAQRRTQFTVASLICQAEKMGFYPRAVKSQ